VTPEQEARLPRYAQDALRALRFELKAVKDALADASASVGEGEVRDPGPYALHRDSSYFTRDVEVPLESQLVRWVLDRDKGVVLEVMAVESRLEGTWELQVRSGGSHTGSMYVVPEVSNVVRVGVKPWR
jgi:hypothetical protein